MNRIRFPFRTSILLSLYNQNVLSDKIVAVSTEPSIPPKGLHLDTLLDYMDFKKADSIGLCIRNSAVAYGSMLSHTP